MRALAAGILAGVCVCLSPIAALAEATTTRIETRPFYGATVTLEEGVRVFRPLPSHDRVIINPNGQTPLSLGISESRNFSYSHNTYSGDGGYVQPGYPAYYGAFGNILPRSHHRRFHGRAPSQGHGLPGGVGGIKGR